jgi:hypothetical protein
MAALGMLLIATLPVDAPVWYLILTGFVFGFGLGNTIAPSTTRMTLATPPARSGSGSAVQNTVRQVAAALGVAIISSIVAVVYANNLTPVIEKSALPANLQAVATDSIGSTFGVADAIDKAGTAPAGATDGLRQAGIDAFMPALHTAGFISLGLLLVALVIFLTRLPANAEAVAWAGAGVPSAGPGAGSGVEGDGAPDAAHQVHVVDEHGDGLEHVEDAPLELDSEGEQVPTAVPAPEKA